MGRAVNAESIVSFLSFASFGYSQLLIILFYLSSAYLSDAQATAQSYSGGVTFSSQAVCHRRRFIWEKKKKRKKGKRVSQQPLSGKKIVRNQL